MPRRTLIAVALAAVTAMPVIGVHAEAACDVPIYLFSNTRVRTGVEDPQNEGRELQPGNPSAASSGIGCLVIGEDFPETPWDDRDTDYIYPGANNLQVRWLEGGMPVSGTLTFAGETHDLIFTPDNNGLTEVLDSQRIWIDPALSIGGGDAVVTVCRTSESCETRIFRTIDRGPQ